MARAVEVAVSTPPSVVEISYSGTPKTDSCDHVVYRRAGLYMTDILLTGKGVGSSYPLKQLWQTNGKLLTVTDYERESVYHHTYSSIKELQRLLEYRLPTPLTSTLSPEFLSQMALGLSSKLPWKRTADGKTITDSVTQPKLQISFTFDAKTGRWLRYQFNSPKAVADWSYSFPSSAKFPASQNFSREMAFLPTEPTRPLFQDPNLQLAVDRSFQSYQKLGDFHVIANESGSKYEIWRTGNTYRARNADYDWVWDQGEMKVLAIRQRGFRVLKIGLPQIDSQIVRLALPFGIFMDRAVRETNFAATVFGNQKSGTYVGEISVKGQKRTLLQFIGSAPSAHVPPPDARVQLSPDGLILQVDSDAVQGGKVLSDQSSYEYLPPEPSASSLRQAWTAEKNRIHAVPLTPEPSAKSPKSGSLVSS